jgi:hypothetical protein
MASNLNPRRAANDWTEKAFFIHLGGEKSGVSVFVDPGKRLTWGCRAALVMPPNDVAIGQTMAEVKVGRYYPGHPGKFAVDDYGLAYPFRTEVKLLGRRVIPKGARVWRVLSVGYLAVEGLEELANTVAVAAAPPPRKGGLAHG